LLKDPVREGDIITLPIWTDLGAEAAAAEYSVSFNPDRLEPLSAEPGEMVANLRFDKNSSAGKMNGVFYHLGGGTFGPATGDFVNLKFRLKTGEFRASDVTLDKFVIVNRGAAYIPAEIKNQLPTNFALEQNYPNPFNSNTNINFELMEDSQVELSVYDILGRKIAMLQNGFLPAGTHSVTWNGRSDSGEQMATGIFFYRLQSSNFDETKKMLLVK
jgi:hypothetical protein